ncbi:MAG: M10 family metallopeptidase C-terminal domain-containing protein [Candidatus Nanopelagicales bacterium]
MDDGSETAPAATGKDTVSYADLGPNPTITLDGRIADDGSVGENDSIAADIANVNGGSADDVITGDLNANVLRDGSGGHRR